MKFNFYGLKEEGESVDSTVEFFLNAKLKSNDNESRIFELVFNFHAFDKQKCPNE